MNINMNITFIYLILHLLITINFIICGNNLECSLVNSPTILLYNITNGKGMTVHLSHNTIIQCANNSWEMKFWNQTLATTSITSKSLK